MPYYLNINQPPQYIDLGADLNKSLNDLITGIGNVNTAKAQYQLGKEQNRNALFNAIATTTTVNPYMYANKVVYPLPESQTKKWNIY